MRPIRVFIAGIDGYLGWPLALHLINRGHTVAGADNFFRRKWVQEMGSCSVTPILGMEERCKAVEECLANRLLFWKGDLRSYEFVEEIFREFEPETIVHLGECPSAPYSMIDIHHATFVQMNNITTTLNILFAMENLMPEAHLVKLGTMGEYGTPNIDIPEGFFEVEFRGRTDYMPFPRQANSWYHWSKVHDSNNVMFACKNWGLRATDVMQGIVFGTRIEEMRDYQRMMTRFDIDQSFGTVVNRFCAQAVIGHPLTLYGLGSQRRGFIPLRDSMQCLTLSVENPPNEGEYRVFNQFQEIYSLSELALLVQDMSKELGLEAEVVHTQNPRKERETHYYKADHQNLLDLGYKPTENIRSEISQMLVDLMGYRERILELKAVLLPDIHWEGQNHRVALLDLTPAEARKLN
jgi:UDP-sulfoquinovose synthase